MASQTPDSMKAIALSHYCKPSEYDFATVPTPRIVDAKDVLIKVHAASINPVDVKMASGMAKAVHKDSFPYLIGYDVAGTVVAIGTEVASFKVGDEIYSRVPVSSRGTVAEYVVSPEYAIAKKPAKLSFTEAASVPLVALTALQSMDQANKTLTGGLKGKTVLVPAGLSGTGSLAVQLAKNVFGASEVITTLSTGKMSRAKELLGDNTFTAVDYTKQDVAKTVGKETVDFLFDTMATTISLLGTVKKGGVIISISTPPPGSLIAETSMPDMPFIARYLLDFVDWGYGWWVGRAGVKYSWLSVESRGEDLVRLTGWIEEGKIIPIVGRTTKFTDLDGIRQGCGEVFQAKGGIGKFVIEMD